MYYVCIYIAHGIGCWWCGIIDFDSPVQKGQDIDNGKAIPYSVPWFDSSDITCAHMHGKDERESAFGCSAFAPYVFLIWQ